MPITPTIHGKTCIRCNNKYPLTTEFWHQDKHKSDGWTVNCKECRHILSKISRERCKLNKRNPPTTEQLIFAMTHKRCPQCKKILPRTTDFWHRSTRNGLASACKNCVCIKRRSIKQKEQKNKARKLWRKAIRLEILSHYGGGTPKCECCGETNIEFLAIDHINGGGESERHIYKTNSSKFLRMIKNNGYPPRYRVLCYNCNCSLGYYMYCPHRTTKVDIEQLHSGMTTTQRSAKQRRQNIRLEVLVHYSDRIPYCDCCGNVTLEFLAIDHINGSGSRERTINNVGSTGRYYSIRKLGYPAIYRVLCHNCNGSLGYYGYCPHKKSKL